MIFAFFTDIIAPVNMEEYSSGRRGVTRNLVGRGTGARVQIPSPPPEKPTSFDLSVFIEIPPLRVGEILPGKVYIDEGSMIYEAIMAK